MKSIAVLIPIHNGLSFTRVALSNLRLAADKTNLDKLNVKQIVIDDGSTDGSYDAIKNEFSEVTVLKGDGNLWWSGAINMGAKHALERMGVEYLLLWNNDIVFSDDYFENLFNMLDKTDPGTIIGSKILVKEQPDLVWSMGGYFNPKTGKYGMYGYYDRDTEEYGLIKSVDWLTGMGTLIPRKVVDKIGYWDSINFPQYHGDSDFTYRAKLAGFDLLVFPSLILFNSVKNSGIEHEGDVMKLFQLFTSTKSKSNIRRVLKFYNLYAKSFRAYLPLIWSYFCVIGGFFKSKILKFFGRQNNI